ncbi:MAG: NAD(P)-dependent alcohol dehydrogenase [Litorilinea sp.]
MSATLMKAAVYTNYGSPEALAIRDVVRPVPQNNEVLVKVYASSVNRTDEAYLRAKPWFIRFFSGLLRPRRTILGNEYAGVVEAVGAHVTAFRQGEKVFGYAEPEFGGHAEYLVAHADGPIARMPSNLSFTEAAACNEGLHYAYSNVRAAPVSSETSVLINGTTGAIGSAAVQLYKYFGAHVTAVCDTARVELVASLGADVVLDYKQVDFTKSKETFDIVFDAVGNSSFFACKHLITPGGAFFSTDLGPYASNPLLALWTRQFGSYQGRRILFPFPTHSKEDIEFFVMLIEEGQFKPLLDRTYPLAEIVEAFHYVEAGHKTGNVVITVHEP